MALLASVAAFGHVIGGLTKKGLRHRTRHPRPPTPNQPQPSYCAKPGAPTNGHSMLSSANASPPDPARKLASNVQDEILKPGLHRAGDFAPARGPLRGSPGLAVVGSARAVGDEATVAWWSCAMRRAGKEDGARKQGMGRRSARSAMVGAPSPSPPWCWEERSGPSRGRCGTPAPRTDCDDIRSEASQRRRRLRVLALRPLTALVGTAGQGARLVVGAASLLDRPSRERE